MAPSITETQVFTALRAFILTIVDCEVIRLPVNRASMPVGEFIGMSPLLNAPLSTNVASYTPTEKNVERSSQISIQIDCYAFFPDRKTTPQQSANALTIDLIEVDRTYPP
jgi:hypothetical protein